MNEQEQNEFLIKKGIIRKVFETKDFEIFALCGTGYIVHEKGEVSKENGMNIYTMLDNREAEVLMTTPAMTTLYAILSRSISSGNAKVFGFTKQMINKCEILKSKVDSNPRYQIDPQAEAIMLQKAQEYLKANNIEQSAPGMGGR